MLAASVSIRPLPAPAQRVDYILQDTTSYVYPYFGTNLLNIILLSLWASTRQDTTRTGGRTITLCQRIRADWDGLDGQHSHTLVTVNNHSRHGRVRTVACRLARADMTDRAGWRSVVVEMRQCPAPTLVVSSGWGGGGFPMELCIILE